MPHKGLGKERGLDRRWLLSPLAVCLSLLCAVCAPLPVQAPLRQAPPDLPDDSFPRICLGLSLDPSHRERPRYLHPA